MVSIWAERNTGRLITNNMASNIFFMLVVLRYLRQDSVILSELKKNPGFTCMKPGLKIGDDLLSRECSTIGANGFNFSVRNGKRWCPIAIVT